MPSTRDLILRSATAQPERVSKEGGVPMQGRHKAGHGEFGKRTAGAGLSVIIMGCRGFLSPGPGCLWRCCRRGCLGSACLLGRGCLGGGGGRGFLGGGLFFFFGAAAPVLCALRRGPPAAVSAG